MSVRGYVPPAGTIDVPLLTRSVRDLYKRIDEDVRTKLDANTTYYVATTGSDTANDGLSAASPFATLQHAWDHIYKNLDLNGYTLTIQIADGTYTAGVNICGEPPGQFYASQIIFQGNSGTPANVLISVTGGYCFNIGEDLGGSAKVYLKDMELRTTTSGSCIRGLNGGTDILFENIRFGACASAHIEGHHNCYIKAVGNYAVTGNSLIHWYALSGAVIVPYTKTITFSNSPAITIFAYCLDGAIYCDSMTFTNGNTVTGQRYYVAQNGQIATGGSETYLPGNAAGASVHGGIYAGSQTGGVFRAHKNGTSQVISDATDTTVTFGTEAFDSGGEFSSNTWTPKAGPVRLVAQIAFTTNVVAGGLHIVNIMKDGTAIATTIYVAVANGGVFVSVTVDDYANGSNAYTVVAKAINGASTTIDGTANNTYFSGLTVN